MLVTEPPAVPWLVDGLVALGALTILVGREGKGKSLTAMQLAVAVASGATEVAGMPCFPGHVLVIDAENGSQEIHRRLQGLGMTPDDADRLLLHEAHGWHLEHDLSQLAALLSKHAPALVVLDSFRSLWPGGDENDSAAVARALDPLRNLLRAHCAAGLLLHHLSKNGSYRGSTGIGAACELVYRLDSADGDPDAQRRRLTCLKSRPAAKPPTRWLRIASHDGRLLLEPTGAHVADTRARTPVRDDLRPRMLDVIRANPGRRLKDWATAVGRDPRDATLRRLRDELVLEGLVDRDADDLYWPAGDAAMPGDRSATEAPARSTPVTRRTNPGSARAS